MDSKNNKMRFSEIIAPQERSILLWFLGSLVLGFLFSPFWVITLFLGLSVIPLLVPKLGLNFFAFLAQESGDGFWGKLFSILGLLFLALLGIMILAMFIGAITNPPLRG